MSTLVDTTQFDRKWKEYLKYSKRALTESVNQKAYFIARNAVNVTKAVSKEEIRKDLEAASKKFPGVPIAAIMVNVTNKKKGKKGLRGAAMRTAVEKFIRIRQSHRNFLRSGWLPAVKELEKVVPKKTGKKIPGAITRSGRKLYGGSKAAMQSMKPSATIWNSIWSKTNKGTVDKHLIKGAQDALDLETKSMEAYILKKLEAAKRKAGF